MRKENFKTKQCHPERSEGSLQIQGDSLSTAQNDKIPFPIFAGAKMVGNDDFVIYRANLEKLIEVFTYLPYFCFSQAVDTGNLWGSP